MRRVLFLIVAAAALSGAPAMAKKKAELTPMELQSIQSREFETDKSSAFSSVMTVIQDLGYIVESADVSTGFITAYSPTENKTGFFEAIGGISSSGNTRMTAFISQMPSGLTKVRLNFLNSKESSSLYGQQSRKDKPILDPAVYTVAWDKVDEALFVLTALSEPTKPKDSNSKSAVVADENASSSVDASAVQSGAGFDEGAQPVSKPVLESVGG